MFTAFAFHVFNFKQQMKNMHKSWALTSEQKYLGPLSAGTERSEAVYKKGNLSAENSLDLKEKKTLDVYEQTKDVLKC